MPVVRPERYCIISSSLKSHQFVHHRVHINIAIEVICFEEVTISIAQRASKVHKIYTIA